MITQRILSLLEEKSLTATDLCRAIGINTIGKIEGLIRLQK